jgi:hypothetical protein
VAVVVEVEGGEEAGLAGAQSFVCSDADEAFFYDEWVCWVSSSFPKLSWRRVGPCGFVSEIGAV